MSEFKTYERQVTTSEMRPHIPGDSLEGVSVSDVDKEAGYPERVGSFVARNPDNHADQWFVNADYFAKIFKPEPIN